VVSRKNELQLAYASDDDIGMSHCRLDHRVERPPSELTFQGLMGLELDQQFLGPDPSLGVR